MHEERLKKCKMPQEAQRGTVGQSLQIVELRSQASQVYEPMIMILELGVNALNGFNVRCGDISEEGLVTASGLKHMIHTTRFPVKSGAVTSTPVHE